MKNIKWKRTVEKEKWFKERKKRKNETGRKWKTLKTNSRKSKMVCRKKEEKTDLTGREWKILNEIELGKAKMI